MARILVLEPDADVRALLARWLTRLGHETLDLDDAPDGVDLVLLEPASSKAVAAARAIHEAAPDVPVVCASIYPRDRVSAFPSSPFLVKPVRLAELDGALRAALDGA